MKINIKYFTFIVPVRVDSIIRIENLLMSIQYLLKNFETNITVLEASDYNNGILQKLLDKKVEYVFFEDKDPIFYRTKYLNIMTIKSTTPYVGIWDADVIIPKDQIIDSVEKIRNCFEIAFPYDGSFFDTSEIIREYYLKHQEVDVLIKNKNKMEKIYGENMGGGAIFVNKNAYILSGMENERYYGWGLEDGDRLERWITLNYRIYRSSGCLFHLTHPRTLNSTYRSNEHL